MDALTIRFDEVSLVRQDGGRGYRNYSPRQTVFSFMSAGKYFPYVAAPGWPEIHSGLTVTALLEAPDDWKSLLGWINQETGEVAGPSPNEYFKQAGVTAVWLCVGVFLAVIGVQKASIMTLVGVLFSASCAFSLYAEIRDWKKAKATLQALERLAQELRHDRSFDTDAQVRLLPSVAPGLHGGQVQR